jgi:hypothetical protein
MYWYSVPTLREWLAAAAAASALGLQVDGAPRTADQRDPAGARIKGAILIMNTPFTESGAVDFESLAAEVRFINRCGGKAFQWGQLDQFLNEEERMQAMEIVVRECWPDSPGRTGCAG